MPREGFEPPTVGLEVHCSIQLSYRGMLPSEIVQTTRRDSNTLHYQSITSNKNLARWPVCAKLSKKIKFDLTNGRNQPLLAE